MEFVKKIFFKLLKFCGMIVVLTFLLLGIEFFSPNALYSYYVQWLTYNTYGGEHDSSVSIKNHEMDINVNLYNKQNEGGQKSIYGKLSISGKYNKHMSINGNCLLLEFADGYVTDKASNFQNKTSVAVKKISNINEDGLFLYWTVKEGYENKLSEAFLINSCIEKIYYMSFEQL